MKRTLIYFIVFTSILIASCGDNYDDDDSDDSDNNVGSDDDVTSSCGIDDGTHSATIDYYNSETGYSNTYDLDVQVEDCQVTEIDFSNGGYLDDSHIDAADIDENGDASAEDDRGRSFDIHISD